MKRFLTKACVSAAVLAHGAAAGEGESAAESYAPPSVDGVLFLASFQDAEHGMIPSTDAKYAGQEKKFTVGQKDSVAVGIDGDKALYFDQPSHFGLTAKVDDIKPNGGDLVLQYEVRYTQDVTCGGAYLKFLDAEKFSDPSKLNNESPYIVMFGPDKCGSDTNKVHFILRHKNPVSGEWSEHHFNSPPKIKTDKYSHLYTLVIHPDNTFEIKIDDAVETTGSLLEDMTPPINPSEEIDDPEDKKPEDWVDEAKIKDPEQSKPEDWDEDAPKKIPDMSINKPEGWWDDEPEQIPDPTAEMPEDWDEEDDGVWEAPLVANPKCKNPGCGEWKRPEIANPDYKGKWIHPMIDNPEYDGEWAPKQIPNPNYFVDETPAELPAIGAVAVEVMSNFAGTSFDNILIATSGEAASEFAAQTFAIKSKAEKSRSEDRARAKRHADRLKLLESGGFLNQVQYYFGEGFEAVRSNPIAAIMTVLVLIVGSVFACCKCCCSDDDVDDIDLEPHTVQAKKETELPADDDNDAPEMDEDAKEETADSDTKPAAAGDDKDLGSTPKDEKSAKKKSSKKKRKKKSKKEKQ